MEQHYLGLLILVILSLNKVLLIHVVERNCIYPVKVVVTPPCSYMLLLIDVEEDLIGFFLLSKKIINTLFNRLKALLTYQNV